jgi:hypothetical protein
MDIELTTMIDKVVAGGSRVSVKDKLFFIHSTDVTLFLHSIRSFIKYKKLTNKSLYVMNVI